MSAAERLRAVADDSDATAARLAARLPAGTLESVGAEQMPAVRLVRHYEGRARLHRRCADAAERIGAIDPVVTEAP